MLVESVKASGTELKIMEPLVLSESTPPLFRETENPG
jgi:hypothetical protein